MNGDYIFQTTLFMNLNLGSVKSFFCSSFPLEGLIPIYNDLHETETVLLLNFQSEI